MAITKLELQSQLQAVLSELEQYKETSHHLQFEMNKQLLLNELKKQQNCTLEYQIKRLEKENEKFKRMLSDKNEKISHLKSHNQTLEYETTKTPY